MPFGPGHDPSSGWEAAAPWFIQHAAGSTIGVASIRRWSERLGPGATILELGCGPGGPRSDALRAPGRRFHALDASPTLLAAYQRRYPDAVVTLGAAQHATLDGGPFDGIVAWGLLFLLSPEDQALLLERAAGVLSAHGRLLFTAPAEACTWADATTGRPSCSLGRAGYEAILARCGLRVAGTELDEGENHYYDVTHTTP